MEIAYHANTNPKIRDVLLDKIDFKVKALRCYMTNGVIHQDIIIMTLTLLITRPKNRQDYKEK